jgi:hypothetical protein
MKNGRWKEKTGSVHRDFTFGASNYNIVSVSLKRRKKICINISIPTFSFFFEEEEAAKNIFSLLFYVKL